MMAQEKQQVEVTGGVETLDGAVVMNTRWDSLGEGLHFAKTGTCGI